MGTTLESFTAPFTALDSGPPGRRSAPLVQVGRGSGSGCRALLVYVMAKLLTQVARGSGWNPPSLARGVVKVNGVTLHRAPLPSRDHPVGAAQSSETIANEVVTIGTAMAGGITACVVWPCAIPLRICRP